MGLARRKFTKEFKEAAVRRLESGASVAEVALSCHVNPNAVDRWRRELREYGGGAFSGYGRRRAEQRPIQPRTRSVIFRLTQDEYHHLEAACSMGGARSLSDFARSRVLRATGEPSLAEVEKKVDEIKVAVQQLTHILVKS